MNDELKAAAERLRADAYADWDYMDGIYASDKQLEDRRLIAKAYLAEHPADNDEPITDSWLRKIGFQDMETGLESQDHVVIVNAWGMDFTVCNGKPKPETRGDVRRLAKALGLELKEQK